MTTTESASGRYRALETWPTEDLVDGMIESQYSAVAAVQAASGSIVAAIDAAVERLRGGGRLIYAGAGTSGRIAAQDAAELPPTFSWPYERAVPVMAGGEAALLRAVEGAEDDGAAARQALDELGLTAQDVVIGVAASGNTPFAVAALARARDSGALAIAVYNNRDGRMAEVADVRVLIETGAELLAGSTRLKAGTAQKVVLNCISTGIMVRLGFVYRGLMVEMQPTNAKLQQRARRVVAELADCSEDTAAAALAEAGDSIKLATVMLVKSLDRGEAEALLARGGGTLRGALG
ncbi:MAG TPA: N-acetylmuramic acid 6-phosphate etherase [Devosiaceae bacterium]|jgi:N-acetylmuramic acid 6-phosphate etherase|nr:N-acetylmuramic acid 6-phosphate etherase [Devosiaceae bacterium]